MDSDHIVFSCKRDDRRIPGLNILKVPVPPWEMIRSQTPKVKRNFMSCHASSKTNEMHVLENVTFWKCHTAVEETEHVFHVKTKCTHCQTQSFRPVHSVDFCFSVRLSSCFHPAGLFCLPWTLEQHAPRAANVGSRLNFWETFRKKQ